MAECWILALDDIIIIISAYKSTIVISYVGHGVAKHYAVNSYSFIIVGGGLVYLRLMGLGYHVVYGDPSH